MNLPAFTAEAALCNKARTAQHTAPLHAGQPAEGVVPQMRASFNCSGSAKSRRQCEAWCYILGGGMSSESDGSITCSIY